MITEAEIEAVDASHRAILRRFAFKFVKNVEDAEDIVQKAFISTWNARHSFRGESMLCTYLTTAVRNHALTMLRKNRQRQQNVELHDDLRFIDPAASIEEVLIEEQRMEMVHGMVNSLARRQRETMRFVLAGNHAVTSRDKSTRHHAIVKIKMKLRRSAA